MSTEPDYAELAKTTKGYRKKITTPKLIAKIAERADVDYDELRRIFAVTQNVIAEELAKGQEINLFFLGKLRMTYYSPRRFVNPKTGVESIVENRASISLRVNPAMKNYMTEIINRMPAEEQVKVLNRFQRKLLAETGDLPENSKVKDKHE